MPDLTPAQERSVDLALRAGRYRARVAQLQVEAAQLHSELDRTQQQRDQLRRILDDVLHDTRSTEETDVGPGAWLCDQLDSCVCSIARAWRILNDLPEWPR